MSRRLEDILNDVDNHIASKMREKTASVKKQSDEEIQQVINFLNKSASQSVKTAEANVPEDDYTIIEKLAYAQAIAGTLENIEFWSKIESMEKKAQERGIPQDKINAEIEKLAAGRLGYVAPIVGALGAAGGGYVGHKFGKNKGTSEGYAQAIQDVDQALGQYTQP